MASVIDISILNSLSTIIVFVIVFIGGWGIMMVVDPFKEKGRSFYGLLSFLLAVLIVVSKTAVAVIMTATPWLMVLSLVGFFFIFFAKMFGKGDADISASFGKSFGWVIFFVAVILIFALGTSLGPGLLQAQFPNQGTTTTGNGTATGEGTLTGPTGTTDFGSNVVFTFFHPKILGVLFLFVLGTLAIIMLGGKN